MNSTTLNIFDYSPKRGTLGKLWRTLRIVTHYRGFFHALKVALGPTLDTLGLIRLSGDVRELIYWERQIVGVGSYSEQTNQTWLNPEFDADRVPEDVKPYLSLIPKGGKVLDVGCGPMSRLSWGTRFLRYQLTATDLLTTQYRALFLAYGLERLLQGVNYVECAAEALGSRFNPQTFDFISINNAIDHTSSPRETLRQLVQVTKRGGYIVITGHSREGSHEKWQGMHQHDIWVDNGNLMRCGKGGKDTERLNAGLDVSCISCVAPKDPQGDMVIVFRRCETPFP